MRCVLVMFDSLNRRKLPNYGFSGGCTENFKRLGEKTVTFENAFVGSMPCMPARRDLQTGRYNFLHRSWGPVEPFDNSFPEILKNNDIFSYLVSDHYHYWEDGGATYHSRYSAWDCVRGQEADTWSLQVKDPEIPAHIPTMREFTHPSWWRNNWASREALAENSLWPQTQTFDRGMEFLEKNKTEDNWFLQIETFDPHEPFNAPDEYLEKVGDDYDGEAFDWPPYGTVTESEKAVHHLRKQYEALLGLCDENMGRVLDFFDENNMWEDTMLIVTTDHGYFLGEKDWWAKSVMPLYNELANIPFFMWDPRVGKFNTRSECLIQNIDIAPTVLEAFSLPIPEEMLGKSLYKTLQDDTAVREYALYGFHGSFINITDGEHVLMKSSESLSNEPLNEYTLLPTHQQAMFKPEEFTEMEAVGPFPYTKGAKIMKIPAANRLKNATFCNSFQYGDMLWNIKEDPEQKTPVNNDQVKNRFKKEMVKLMRENDAPEEQYVRMGLTGDSSVNDGKSSVFESLPFAEKYEWSQEMKNMLIGMLSLMPSEKNEEFIESFDTYMEEEKDKIVKRKVFEKMAKKYYSDCDQKNFYFINKLARID